MEFNKTVLMAALVLAVVALAYLFLNSTADKGKLFLSELEAYKAKLKMLEEKGYYYEGISVVGSEEANVYVLKNSEGYWVKKETPLYAWEVVGKGNESYVCLTFTERACSEVSGSTAKIADMLTSLLLTEEYGERMLKTWKIFYSANAMEVKEAYVNDTYAFFSILFSYSLLSVEKLKELGYSPNMPIAKLSNVTMNATFEDHLMVDRVIYFEEPYQHYERFTITALEEGSNRSLPEVEPNETAFYDQYYALDGFLEELQRNGVSRSSVAGLAIHYSKPEACTYYLEGEDVAMCIDAYIAFTGDGRACSLLEDADGCYYNVAVGQKRAEWCDYIEDLDKKAQCFASVVANSTESEGGQKEAEGTTAEES